jgi:hypothetical protein
MHRDLARDGGKMANAAGATATDRMPARRDGAAAKGNGPNRDVVQDDVVNGDGANGDGANGDGATDDSLGTWPLSAQAQEA